MPVYVQKTEIDRVVNNLNNQFNHLALTFAADDEGAISYKIPADWRFTSVDCLHVIMNRVAQLTLNDSGPFQRDVNGKSTPVKQDEIHFSDLRCRL